MEVFYTVLWFFIGCIFGSFFHVVGYRLPIGKSLISPKYSYCPECGHKLGAFDLIPILSFLFSRGKCRYCKHSISWFYPLLEVITGLLFCLSYHLFGYSYSFVIAILLSSLLSIVLVSDTLYLIISDEVILIVGIFLFVVRFLFLGWKSALMGLGVSFLSFLFMYLIMLLGKVLFKKECLGGADIKLMIIAGLVLDPFLCLCVIFLASFLALPISLILLITNDEHVVPFGPFLVLSMLVLVFSGVSSKQILDFLAAIL